MKRLSRFLPALILSSMLVACSDNDPVDPGPDPEPDPGDPEVSAVVVSPEEAEIEIGETVSLTAEVEGDDGVSEAVTWTSSDADIADVSSSGVVTGVAEGTATIRATSDADTDVFGEADVTVNPPPVGAECGEGQELSDDITTDTTLPRGCHRVTDNITVSAALTVQPGAFLEFVERSGFRIADGGSLLAVGTAEDPITFTSVSREPNDWAGIGIFATTESVLDHVVIENAGRTWNAINSSTSTNLYVHSDARVAITNSTFRTSGGYGVYLEDPTSSVLTAFDHNEFDGNARAPIRLYSRQLHWIGTGNTFGTNAPSGSRFIAVRASSIDTTQTWQNLDVPHRFFGNHFIDDPDATVTIEPGTILEFADAGLRVNAGTLRAVGEEGDSITFTSVSREPNDWRGLGIASNSAENVLDYVVIENAGVSWNAITNSRSTNLYVHSNARVAVTNSTFRTSGGYGVYLGDASTSILTVFDDNTFDGNGNAPIRLYSSQLHMIGTGNSFATNAPVGRRYIHVAAATSITSQTWRNLDLPYRFFGNHFINDPMAMVTIEPGTIIRFDGGLRVNAGALRAVGTENDRITFTSVGGDPGDWRGVGINSSSSDNALQFVTIEDAGDSWNAINNSNPSNLYVSGVGRIVVTNNAFENSSGWGIYNDGTITDASGAAINPATNGNNTFSGNASGDVGS